MTSTDPDRPSGDGAADGGDLPAKLERLESLPADEREALVEVIETVSHHSGPICSPADLERYEAILPGLAERIVRLPEREQEHRHRVVEATVKRDYDLRSRGQLLAIVALAMLLGFSVLLALIGHPDWAGRVAIGTIVAVVGIFVTGRWLQHEPDGGTQKD